MIDTKANRNMSPLHKLREEVAARAEKGKAAAVKLEETTT